MNNEQDQYNEVVKRDEMGVGEVSDGTVAMGDKAQAVVTKIETINVYGSEGLDHLIESSPARPALARPVGNRRAVMVVWKVHGAGAGPARNIIGAQGLDPAVLEMDLQGRPGDLGRSTLAEQSDDFRSARTGGGRRHQ